MKKIIVFLRGLLFGKPRSPYGVPDQVNIEFSGRTKDAVKNLMDKTENRSVVDLLRKSLTIYNVLIDHADNGGKVILRLSDGTEYIFDPVSFPAEIKD